MHVCMFVKDNFWNYWSYIINTFTKKKSILSLAIIEPDLWGRRPRHLRSREYQLVIKKWNDSMGWWILILSRKKLILPFIMNKFYYELSLSYALCLFLLTLLLNHLKSSEIQHWAPSTQRICWDGSLLTRFFIFIFHYFILLIVWELLFSMEQLIFFSIL